MFCSVVVKHGTSIGVRRQLIKSSYIQVQNLSQNPSPSNINNSNKSLFINRNKTPIYYHQTIKNSKHDWKKSLQLLLEMCSEFQKVDVSTYNLVMHTANVMKKPQVVDEVFNLMESHNVKPDINTYQNLIFAYKQSNDYESAYQLLLNMNNNDDVKPNISCFRLVLKICNFNKQYDKMFDIYNHMLLLKVQPDVTILNLFLHTCFSTLQWDRLIHIYDTLVDKTDLNNNNNNNNNNTTYDDTSNDVLTINKIPGNQKTYHYISNAYAKLGNWSKCLDYMNEMKLKKIHIDWRLYHSVLYSCAQTGQVDMCLNIIEEMKKEIKEQKEHVKEEKQEHASYSREEEFGIKRKNDESLSTLNEHHYSALILAYTKNKQYKEAVDVIDMIENAQKEGYMQFPMQSSKCYDMAISAAGKCGEWVTALELFDTMISKKIKPTQITFNCIITACSKSGQHDKATKFLYIMEGYGFQPDQESYGACLYGLAIKQEFVTMFKILESMEKKQIKPGISCLNSVLHAFERVGYYKDAIEFLSTMRELGSTPDVISYTSAINSCNLYGKYEQALLLHEEMISYDIKPNLHTYSALINTCKVRGKFEEAYKVFEILLEKGYQPNSYIYAGLIGSARHSKYAPEVYEILENMHKIKGNNHNNSRVELDIHIYREIFQIMRRDKNIDGMLSLLKHMHSKNIEPNIQILSHIIHTFDIEHRDEEAKQFMLYYRDTFEKHLFIQSSSENANNENANNENANILDLSNVTKAVGRNAIRVLLDDFILGKREPCDFKIKTSISLEKDKKKIKFDKYVSKYHRYINMIPPLLLPSYLEDDNPMYPQGILISKIAIIKWLKQLKLDEEIGIENKKLQVLNDGDLDFAK